MKINNQIVEALNAGLADLFYEVGLLSRLVDFKSDKKLQKFIDTKFERIKEPEVVTNEDGSIEIVEVERVSDEETLRDSLVNAMGQVGVKNSKELMDMLTARYKSSIVDLETAQELVKNLRDDVAAVVQIDRVVDSLMRFGIKDESKVDIESIRDTKLAELMEVLLVKVEITEEG